MSWIDELRRRVRAPRWPVPDLALAATLVVLSLAYSESDVDATWTVFTVVIVAGLVARRRWPLTAVLLTVLGVLGHLAWTGSVEPIDLGVPIALFTLANTEGRRRAAAITFIVMLAGLGALSLAQPVTNDKASVPRRGIPEGDIIKVDMPLTVVDESGRRRVAGPATIVREPKESAGQIATALWRGAGVMFLLGFAYLLGDNMRGRRLHLRTLEQRAADLEREQQQRVALATAAERARITRELHDVVAHGLSVMVVQAQGGAAALRRHPERTESALRNVIDTGRSSLAEMRRLLAVVRQDGPDDTELAPQPGVGALPELIDRIRDAGTPVTFTVEGEPVALPAGVDLSAYRIAQEALTNALKHGGDGVSVAVRLGYQRDDLAIEVSDDGTGGTPPPDNEGHGLRGLGERVGILGGELTAGPDAAGGFRVLATLPLRPVAA